MKNQEIKKIVRNRLYEYVRKHSAPAFIREFNEWIETHTGVEDCFSLNRQKVYGLCSGVEAMSNYRTALISLFLQQQTI